MDGTALDDAHRILREHEREWLARPGVQGVAIGDHRDHGGPAGPCLVILITNDGPALEWPVSIDGVPVHVARGTALSQQ